MHSAVESRRVEVAMLCKRLGVRRLDLFGSAAREDFDPSRSDLDFLVEFDSDLVQPVLETYFGLKDALEALFNRPVDLVSVGAVENPYVRAGIERTRLPFYVA